MRRLKRSMILVFSVLVLTALVGLGMIYGTGGTAADPLRYGGSSLGLMAFVGAGYGLAWGVSRTGRDRSGGPPT